MQIKFDVFWKKNLGTLYKDNSITVLGKEANVGLDLNEVHNIYVNFKVGEKSFTDLVEIVDIETKLIRIPFKTDVIKEGTHEFELVATMKNGDVLPSQTYTYAVDKSLENPDSVDAETNYPILINLLQYTGEKINAIDEAIDRLDNSVAEMKGTVNTSLKENTDIINSRIEESLEAIEESFNTYIESSNKDLNDKFKDYSNETTLNIDKDLNDKFENYLNETTLNIDTVVNEAIKSTDEFIEVANVLDKVSNIEGELSEVVNRYGDIENEYAKKAELHNHSNKNILDNITSAKVTEWNNKSTFSGSYNDLTNKPTIPSLNGYATKDYVNQEINKIDITNQLTGYVKKSELPTKVSAFSNDKGYLVKEDLGYITPQMFGAKADGVTDDSEAILKAIAALPKDGGTLYFPAGTYIHGDGTTTGLSYQIDPDRSTDDYFAPLMKNKGVDDRIGRDIRLIFNGYKNLKIIGNGAVLQSHENNGECSNNKFFTFIRCENVLIENIIIDGKRDERDIKLNDYSPNGFDLMRSNLDFTRCKRVIVRNVISKNSMMDGMALGAGSEAEYNEDFLIEQCVFNNNHRQGISIEGATNVVVKDTECSYNGTGKGILPKSGIDVEAYGYVGVGEQYSYNRNILIDNCYFDSNGHSNVISNDNSFNVTFQNCVMKNAGVVATPNADAEVLHCRLENSSIGTGFKRIAYNIFTYNKGGYVIQSLATSGTSTTIIEHNTFDMTPTSETFKKAKYNSMRIEEDETFRYNHVINACSVSGSGYHPIFFACKNFIGNILELTSTSFEGTNVAQHVYVNQQQSKGGKAKDNICIGYTTESASNMNIDEFTTSLKTNYDKAYTHSNSAHAPSNAQKNSDITKAEIEAKLTGEISSHSHSRTDENWGAENVGMVLMVGSDGRLVLYDLADYNPNAQFFNVIQNYTNVSSDYSKTQAKESFPLTITLVTTNGKKLDEVKVIMGGKDVTSTVYSDGKIVITSVTGEIVITADAMLYTNLFDPTHPDFIIGQRWNKAGTLMNNREYGLITNDIPFKKGDTFRIKGLNEVGGGVGSGVGGTVILEIKDEAGSRLYLQCLDIVNGNGFFKSGSYSVDNANSTATFTFTDRRNGFIRISGDRVGEMDEVIITVNEEIK